MVDAINPISASASAVSTQVDRSLSITSEPDNKWFADRQAQIDKDFEALEAAEAGLRSDIARFGGKADEEMEVSPDGRPRNQVGLADAGETETEDDGDQHKLSGESDLIGTVDFDEETPFGHRTAFV